MGRRRRARRAGGAGELERRLPLIPANAGIQLKRIDFTCSYYWVPAFAGTSRNSGRLLARSHFAFGSPWLSFARSHSPDFLNSLVSLFAAFVLGTLIGDKVLKILDLLKCCPY